MYSNNNTIKFYDYLLKKKIKERKMKGDQYYLNKYYSEFIKKKKIVITILDRDYFLLGDKFFNNSFFFSDEISIFFILRK